MAKNNVVMPQMGESITNGTISKWHKKVGELIEIDEIFLEISTDKVESEIPSPFSGRVEEILYEEGETIDVGKVLAVIEDEPSSTNMSSATEKKSSAPSVLEERGPESSPKKAEAEAEAEAEVEVDTTDASSKRFFTPLVKKLAKENNVALDELKDLSGSGAGGRVNRADFEAFLAKRSSSSSFSSSLPSHNEGAREAGPSVSGAPKTEERVEIIVMDNMRKAIARNMIASKQTSPHVNSIAEVDLSHLVKYREANKNQFQKSEGFKLTYTPFIMYAIIQALKEYPLLNSSVDNDKIILKKDINLGLAVAVPGNGLLVPVVKSADNLNLLGLCRAVNDLAERARSKKLTVSDLSGGSFTFTNNGSFGVEIATPVILQPQVGIYCAGVIKKVPIVLPGDAIGIRSVMYGTHTYDHRVIDGEVGGKFLMAVHRHLIEMVPAKLL